MPTIFEIWNQKDNWFRDYIQANRVGSVVAERLADDRFQEECRYLIRLKWHFHMGYQEVSYVELQRNVSESKMVILDKLFAEIADHNYTGIDEWLEKYENELPIIEDNWMKSNQDSAPQI